MSIHFSKTNMKMTLPFRSLGITALELIIVLGLLSTMVLVAVEAYDTSRQKANVEQAISDIKDIEIAIENYYMENNYTYPSSLADIGMQDRKDPWGNTYNFLNIAALPDKGNDPKTRKDKNLFPLNSDYDLYSMGEDGKTKISLTDTESQDDVIRANNGSFIGIGSDY